MNEDLTQPNVFPYAKTKTTGTTEGSESAVERVVMCDNCPECGCYDTHEQVDDSLGAGYRVCKNCDQEWWTDIDYPKHIDKRDT